MISQPPVCVYFHGIPGTADELALTAIDRDTIVALDRSAIAIGQSGSDYFDSLTATVAPLGARLHLIGFSLGAAAALQVAARLPGAIAKIDLIAPAAPPELGHFLDDAAGGPIFRLAAQRPSIFRHIVSFQSFLARRVPALLVRALFASSAGADRALSQDPAFRRAIADILRAALGKAPDGYRREIAAYVAPWSDILPSVTAAVTIWQGDADTWSPPAMANALATALPNVAAVNMLPGLSHYSTLKAAMQQIMQPKGKGRSMPSAIIIGAGDATGGAIARAFAATGLTACVNRRAKNADALEALAASIRADGYRAQAFPADARVEEEMIALFDRVESDVGPVEAAVFNIGANVSFPITEMTTRVYTKVWEMACLGGFLMGREAARRMVPRGKGTIIFTGATASLRGGAGYSAFSGAKAALRMLAQSMARELGPQSIHVAHVVIDGAIDTDFIRQRHPEFDAAKSADLILSPAAIAANYVMLHQQPKSAWTHELDLRPWGEKW